MVIRYLKMCPQEEYLEYVNRAEEYIATVSQREQVRMTQQLQKLVRAAELKRQKQPKRREVTIREYQR